VTNEDVPRFSLRRGARFLETFGDQPQSGEIDEGWLADLGEDEDGHEGTDLEDAVTDAGSPDGAGAADVPQPALTDVMTTLAERLAHLEEALVRTASACTVARVVLGQGQDLLDHSPGSPEAAKSPDDAEVVDLRDDKAPSSPRPASTAGSPSRPGAHRHSSETPALTRLINPLRRYGSVSLRELLRPE
jgi:hypothetical protein